MHVGDFMFPIEERSVALEELPYQANRMLNPHPEQAFKAIIRTDTNEVISVVRNSYQLVPNEDLITMFYEELRDRQVHAFIDESHSLVNSQRMRLQITFPEIKFQDGDSEIALCLFIHNSYNGSESVRFVFGAIRDLCENGMVIAETLTEYRFRHRRGVNIKKNISGVITTVFDEWPIVEDKVKLLARTPFNTEIYAKVEQIMGTSWSHYLRSEQPETMWEAYNILTDYISHQLLKDQHARYQQGVSRVFDL